jgi:hypothetical protein
MIRYLSGTLRIVPDDYLDNNFIKESLEVMSLANELLGLKTQSEDEKALHVTMCIVEGLAGALCLFAVKCQDREVRRKAITLLEQHSVVDGYHEAIMAAKIATWFVGQEEKTERKSSPISRFVIEYVYALPDHKMSICLSKQLKNEPHRIVTPPATLSW